MPQAAVESSKAAPPRPGETQRELTVPPQERQDTSSLDRPETLKAIGELSGWPGSAAVPTPPRESSGTAWRTGPGDGCTGPRRRSRVSAGLRRAGLRRTSASPRRSRKSSSRCLRSRVGRVTLVTVLGRQAPAEAAIPPPAARGPRGEVSGAESGDRPAGAPSYGRVRISEVPACAESIRWRSSVRRPPMRLRPRTRR